MAVCAVCGKKTNIFRGFNEFNENVYCDSCFEPIITKYRKDIYDEYVAKYNVPKEYLTVNYKNGDAKMPETKYCVWINNDNLCFFPESIRQRDDYVFYKIPIDKIEYYGVRGETHNQTVITGGGGKVGGSSIGGAILGGLFGGGTGAIIGSRKVGKIEPVKSEVIAHDDRETFLNYYIDNVIHSLSFLYNDHNVFLRLLPDKEYAKCQIQSSIKQVINSSGYTDQTGNSEVIKQIKELSALKDDGIITQEEFNEKKKVLLRKIG